MKYLGSKSLMFKNPPPKASVNRPHLKAIDVLAHRASIGLPGPARHNFPMPQLWAQRVPEPMVLRQALGWITQKHVSPLWRHQVQQLSYQQKLVFWFLFNGFQWI